MNPLPRLPPGLDPFAGFGPLAAPLEPLLRLLRLPLELLYSALTVAANPNGPAAMAAAGAGLGAVIETLFALFVIAVVVVVLVAVLVGLGVGAMLAAAVTAFAARRRRV